MVSYQVLPAIHWVHSVCGWVTHQWIPDFWFKLLSSLRHVATNITLCEDRIHQTPVVYHTFPISTQCILQWQFDLYPRMFRHVQSPWPLGYMIWSIKIRWNPMKVPFKLHPYVFFVLTVPMLIDKHPMKCHESLIFWHVWLKSWGLQVRHGDFFQLLDEEIAAATLIFLQAGGTTVVLFHCSCSIDDWLVVWDMF